MATRDYEILIGILSIYPLYRNRSPYSEGVYCLTIIWLRILVPDSQTAHDPTPQLFATRESVQPANGESTFDVEKCRRIHHYREQVRCEKSRWIHHYRLLPPHFTAISRTMASISVDLPDLYNVW